MIEVLETLAAERKAADDERKQVQTRLEGVRSDVEAVQAQSAKQAETVSGLLVKVADFEGIKPSVFAEVDLCKQEISIVSQNLTRFVVSSDRLDQLISSLSADFHSRCAVYDDYGEFIKSWDAKQRNDFGLMKQDFDDVLASAMMTFKDDIDNRVQAIIVQIKQQEDSIADVVETMGQQNSSQDKVIKEMREAVAALRSS
jgi:hypothetical protein